MFLQSGFLFAVTAINVKFPRSQNHCKMTQPTDPTNSTEALLQELLKTVSTLKDDVSELKRANNDKGNSRKRPRDSEASGSQLVSCDGEDSSLPYEYEGSDDDPISDAEDHKFSEATERFKLFEEGETFLETVFSSKMEYVTRKAKLAKYGQPDSRWTRCPELGSVVEGILSNEALKQDKVSYRSQQLWLKAAGPLVACLEKAHEGNLSLQEAIPMLQSSLMLMGDASQHQSVMRRKDILHHLNPQLKKLMNEGDFAGTQPFLFGEDFGVKAKEKLDAAAALRKVVYQQPARGKSGFQAGYPRKFNRGQGGGRRNNSGPGRYQKRSGNPTSATSEKTSR